MPNLNLCEVIKNNLTNLMFKNSAASTSLIEDISDTKDHSDTKFQPSNASCFFSERERIRFMHSYSKPPEELPKSEPEERISDEDSAKCDVVQSEETNKITNNDIKFLVENSSEPLIFKNILEWEIVNWSLKDWENILKHEKLPCRCGKNKFTKKPQWETTTSTKMCCFNDFIRLNRGSSEEWIYYDYKYLKDWMANAQQLKKNISWARFGYPEIGSEESTIWIGSEGAHTPCHIDTYGCNLVAQVLGRKLWLLFPPEENLLPTRIPYEESTIFSELNFFAPTIKDFKSINNCRTVVLNPGDVLFIPQGWWHYVENLELAISINTWIPMPQDEERRLEEAVVKMIMFQFANDLSQEEKRFALIQNNNKAMEQQQLRYNLNVTHFCLKSYQSFLEYGSNLKTETSDKPLDNKKCIKEALEKFGELVNVIPTLTQEEFLSFLSCHRDRFSTTESVESDGVDDGESGQEVVSKVLNAILKPNVITVIKNNLLSS